jgi:hypothetical protein
MSDFSPNSTSAATTSNRRNGAYRAKKTVKSWHKNPVALVDVESVLEDDWRWKLAQRAARSSVLYRATQLRDILLYIVRQAIIDPDEPIHEFDIAHRVLGRKRDFNPLDDNIVRVQMAHLRKKLDLYFSTEGKEEPTVITVALGSYKPVFSPRAKAVSPDIDAISREVLPANNDEAPAISADTVKQNAAQKKKVSLDRFRIGSGAIVSLAIILVLAGACFSLWVRNRQQQQSLDEMRRTISPWRYQPSLSALWSGFLDSSRDTDVVISDNTFLLIEELRKQQASFPSYLNRSYLSAPQNNAPSADLRYAEDLLASKNLGNNSEFKLAQRITSLDPLDKRIHLYSARQYMPALVKQDNLILIGGHVSNPWSALFEGRLNFTEDTKFQGLGSTVVTNRSPMGKEQPNYASNDAVGYCVVAYMPNSDQEGKVLLLEGTSSEATEAAGDFLLSEEQFSTFRKMLHTSNLPYFEALLKTSQVKGTPLTVTVEAYRIYPDQH